MNPIKLIVNNSRVIVKSMTNYILNISGIRDLNTGTGNVSNNKIDWTLQEFTDTAASFTTNNPILLVGQLGIETDDLLTDPKFKIGNGVTAWNSLPYGATTTVTNAMIGALINAATTATPNDTDLVATAESSVLKNITWTNVKAFLKTYYDTIYTTTSAVATQISTALSGYLTSATAASTYAPIASPTFTGTVTTPTIIVSSETASTIASFDASKNIKSLSVATYPSLTELAYVKGVTNAIQTQLNAKGVGTIIGSASVTNGILYQNGTVDTSATSANMTYNGSTVAFAGTGSDILTITGSGNGSQRSGIRVNASNSLGQATNYMFNDRNATSSYGGQLYGGTTNVTGNLFGVSRVDKYFIFADGASNLGMCIGTLSAQPFILGTNNVERARFLSTGTLLFSAGTATAGSAPLKLTSGTNNTTAEPGAFEYNGTNLFFTRTGTTRENILVGNAAAAAPSTSAGVAIVNFYGTSATNFLGTPNSWASVVISGTTYKIPLYT